VYTPTHVLALAYKIDRQLAANYQDYLDECAEDAKNKHRPHYCEHGMNLWVDYDPICGSCEQGFTSGDPLQRRRRALAEAHQRNDEAEELLSAWSTLTAAGLTRGLDGSVFGAHLRELLTV
jgi:hypothetical protein